MQRISGHRHTVPNALVGAVADRVERPVHRRPRTGPAPAAYSACAGAKRTRERGRRVRHQPHEAPSGGPVPATKPVLTQAEDG